MNHKFMYFQTRKEYNQALINIANAWSTGGYQGSYLLTRAYNKIPGLLLITKVK